MNLNSHSTRLKTKAKQPRTERGQRTRQALLDGAEKVFGRAGFEHTSIAHITQAAGVAVGAFYVYFASKEVIFTALVDELGTRLRRAIAQRVGGHEDRLVIEREGLRAFFDFAAEHKNLYRIIRQAEFVDEVAFRRYYRSLASGYTEGLKAAMQKGHVRTMDPEVLAYALMGIADFIGMRFVLWGDRKRPVAQVIDEVTGFLLEGLTVHHPKRIKRSKS